MNPDLREKVARVIDPEAFEPVPVALHVIRHALNAENELRRETALDQADSILSLLPKWEGGWQPIESAPRDGRELLLAFGTGLNCPSPLVCAWRASDGVWLIVGPELEVLVTPTHWQPLPSPPGEEK